MKTMKTNPGSWSGWKPVTIAAGSLLALTLSIVSCGEEGAASVEGEGVEEEASERGEAHEEEEEHEEDVAFDAGLFDRVKGEHCEHKIPILDCDECRYEVGGVRVSKELLDEAKDGLIRTASASTAPVAGLARLTGEVAADQGRVAKVSSQVSGVSRRVFVSLGDRVAAGARLVEIDSLEMGRLRSSYQQARAQLVLARRNFEREKALHEKQISSEQERLQAETAFQEAEIALRASSEQLRLLGFTGKDLKRFGQQSAAQGRMVLRAPLAGTVVRLDVVRGERVSPEGPLMTIADLSEVWVWADVYERDLGRLLTATAEGPVAATVRVAAFPQRPFAGRVGYVRQTVDEATRTVKAQVVVDNREGLLRPGMFADVELPLGKASQALLLPRGAVVEDEQQRFVFVRADEQLFLRRDVEVLDRPGGLAEVRTGLVAGEEVAVQGAFLLKSDVLREKMGAGCAD